MLRVITGPFHPALESALVEQVRQVKHRDPLAPLAILIPSTHLLERLRRLLALDHRLSLLHVHVLTFHQLALRVADEARRAAPFSTPRVVDALFFEQLVRHVVHSRLSTVAPFRQMSHSSGTWGALWATLRDLKDAGVRPADALRGLSEGYFEEGDRDWLQALFSLQAAVQEVGATLSVGTADDLAESVLPAVPTSPFLRSLRQVFYYGFYDLTQVQLSFFEAVSTTVPTTLFFPLGEGNEASFARRFFERHLHPLASSPDAVTRLAVPHADAGSRLSGVSVRTVIGAEEELATVFRTILDLVETNGYRFEEIGVVARTLEPYSAFLQSLSDRYRVPMTTTASRPLMHEPLCKVLLQLASLPANDFYRTTLLDVVTSPLYATDLIEEASESYRPELWKVAAQSLRITHGSEEWQRVAQCPGGEMAVEGQDEQEGTGGSVRIPPEVLALFWQVVAELLRDCQALPSSGQVGQLVEALRSLAQRHLRRPDSMDGGERDEGARRLATVWNALDRVMEGLAELDALGEDIGWAAFVELLTHAMERAQVPLEAEAHRGVMVLDAMAARGVPFKALFIIGLNDKTFPRHIREDPFLRDRHRRVLAETFGFKIDEKLTGYEEETLLLSLLCRAATQRLYLSYQRADEAGRMLAPSPAVHQALRLVEAEEQPVETVPRRLTERVAQRPALLHLLEPSELAQWLALSGQDPSPLLRATHRDAECFRHAVEAQTRIEDDMLVSSPFDGMTGPLDRHWSRLLERGVAPTPLERYARCPFQYFSRDVLRLDPVRVAPSQEPDAAVLGTFCHAALRLCYERLIPIGWPAEPVTDDTVEWCIHSAVEEAATDCERTQGTGHYLLWERAKDLVAELLTDAIEADQAAQAESPYSPIAFEMKMEGRLPEIPLEEPLAVKTYGWVDRIDRHQQTGAIRIVDYKFKTGPSMQAEDRHLLQSAVRGHRLQPPLYACLEVSGQSRPDHVQFMFLAPHWAHAVSVSTFPASAWLAESGTRIARTLGVLLSGIREGSFVIQPGGYCEHCDYRVVCRSEHQPTVWRARRSETHAALKTLREQRLPEESRGRDSR